MALTAELAAEAFCYLTTVGRVTGRPHEIEIWFGTEGGSVYILAGDGEKSDTVRNLKREPKVRLRIRDVVWEADARIVTGQAEDALARRLLLVKYAPGHDGDLTSWGREALPVAIDLPN